jgi:hypothetical protein
MRKLLVASVTGLIALAGGGIALAASTWPSVTVTPTVTPSKAGTPAHPQGVTLKTVFHWQDLGFASQPIVTKFVLKYPKGSLYQGGKYPACSLKTISKPSGPRGCPAASIMGSGSGTAYADTTHTYPKITVVNGGQKTIYFYTVLNNPARVAEPVIGHIVKTSGPYAYTLTTTVPNNLRIVAGTPIALTFLQVTAGKGAWLATTGCFGGHWRYVVTTSYESSTLTGPTTYGSSSTSASVKCHK